VGVAKLRFGEDGREREIDLDGLDRVQIGRHPDCLVRINDTSLSRHHAELRRRPSDGGWEIVDLDSSNGVLVGGKRVRAAALRDGDTMQLGTAVLAFSESRKAGAAGLPSLASALRRPSSAAPPRVDSPPPPPPPPPTARAPKGPSGTLPRTTRLDAIEPLDALELEPSGVNDLDELDLDVVVPEQSEGDQPTAPPPGSGPMPAWGGVGSRSDEPELLRARRELDAMSGRLRAMMDEVGALRTELDAAPTPAQLAERDERVRALERTREELEERNRALLRALERAEESASKVDAGAATREAELRARCEGLEQAAMEAERRVRDAERRAERAAAEADERARAAIAEADERARGAAAEAAEREKLARDEAEERVRQAVAAGDERAQRAVVGAEARAQTLSEENERLRDEVDTLTEMLGGQRASDPDVVARAERVRAQLAQANEEMGALWAALRSDG
jgi:hypothetical protein